MKNKKLVEELIAQANNLDIDDLRDLADFCNDLVDLLEAAEK